MTTRTSRFVLTMLMLALTLPAARAESPASDERVLALSPQGTRLSFLLEASTHDVHGSFGLKSGELRVKPEGGAASGVIVMDAVSAETGNERRDKKMHAKVLESATYPELVFTLASMEGSIVGEGPHDVTLVGTIALHGADHPIRVPSHVTVTGDQVAATAEVTIPYVEWGLHDPSVAFFRVAKTVVVHVDLSGSLEKRGSGGL